MRFAHWIESRACAGIGGALALVAVAMPAKAALVLTVTINGSPVVVADGGALDSDLLPGQITYVDLSSPQFFGSVHAASSNSPGDATGGNLQIDSTLTPLAGGHIVISATDSGFTLPLAGADLLGTTATLTSFGAVAGTFQGFADATTTGPKPLLGPSDSNLDSIPFNYSGSYSLTASIDTVVSPAETLVNVGETVVVTPEPASLALTGLAAGSLLVRRRRD